MNTNRFSSAADVGESKWSNTKPHNNVIQFPKQKKDSHGNSQGMGVVISITKYLTSSKLTSGH